MARLGSMVVKGKFPGRCHQHVTGRWRLKVGAPTLAVVSVRELRVVDLPDDGLPTRPMRGSRGMARWWEAGRQRGGSVEDIGQGR